jgi:hypothetical protein
VPETASSQQLEIMYVNESSHPAAKMYRIRLIHLPYPDGYKVSGLQMSVRKIYRSGGYIFITPATIYINVSIPKKAGIRNWTGC